MKNLKQMKRLTAVLTVCLMLLVIVLQAPAVSACSALELESAEGDTYWFRTCDMDDTYNVFGENGSYIGASELISYPKGSTLSFVTGDVVAEHTVMGMSFGQSLAMLDGMNDAGLTGGLLFLDEGTETADENVPEDFEIMAAMEGVTWFLARCGSVDEVVALANKTCIQALEVPGVPGSDLTATLHFNFVDSTGRNVVIEAADLENPGRFTIYEGTGVMTNSPPYDWQLEHLQEYIGDAPKLQEKGIDSITVNGVKLDGKPTGAEQVLPGGNTPPERLIRLTMSRYFCNEGKTISNADMLARGSGIMSIVNRAIHDKNIEGAEGSYTQYTVCYDVARQQMYIRPYDTTFWTTINLSEVNAEERATYPMYRGDDNATVEALSIGAEEEAAPAVSNTNTALVVVVCILAAAVFFLLLALNRKRKTA